MSSILARTLGSVRTQAEEDTSSRRTSGGARASPYARTAPPTDGWKHDMYGSSATDQAEARGERRSGGGGGGGGARRSKRLIVTNLHYEVSERELEKKGRLSELRPGHGFSSHWFTLLIPPYPPIPFPSLSLFPSDFASPRPIRHLLPTAPTWPPLSTNPQKFDRSGRSTGMAFLGYGSEKEAAEAKEAFNGALAKGQKLTVEFDTRIERVVPEPGTLLARLAADDKPARRTSGGGFGGDPSTRFAGASTSNRGGPRNSLGDRPARGTGGERGGRGARDGGAPREKREPQQTKTSDELDKELEAFMTAPAASECQQRSTGPALKFPVDALVARLLPNHIVSAALVSTRMTQTFQQCPAELQGCQCPTPKACGYSHAGFPQFACFICHRACTTAKNLEVHVAGAAHQNNIANHAPPAATKSFSTPPLLDPTPTPSEFCPSCRIAFTSEMHATEHYNGKRHKAQERVKQAKSVQERAKGGVEVVPLLGVDFGTVDLGENADKHIEKTIQLFIKTGPKTLVQIAGIRVQSLEGSGLPAFTITPPKNLNVPPGSKAFPAGTVTFRPGGNAGHYNADTLVFTFLPNSGNSFTISRSLSAVAVTSTVDTTRYEPRPPFNRKKFTPRAKDAEKAPKMPRPATLNPKPESKLGWFPVPRRFREAFEPQGKIKDQLALARRDFVRSFMTPENYVERFHSLLWIQEIKEDVTVPGLTEKKPAVFIGNIINVRPMGASTRASAGVVTSRRMHEALNSLEQLQRQRIAFPQAPPASPSPPRLNIKFVNPLVSQNSRQSDAIRSILAKSHGPSPFVLFGPPGTGKTVTIVEAVNQLVMTDPTAHILICAPSNSACDVVASRLVSLSPSQLFRLYAPYHHPIRVPAALHSFTIRREGVYEAPSLEKLSKFRVVVVTCATGNLTSRFDVPHGHFSHIFIDECGQAEEPEAIIPLSMADEHTSVILCGDPQQLGPVVHSPVAIAFGLNLSLLERLMRLQLYDPSSLTAAGITVVKLVANYRSHPAILKYPNEKFYGGELQPVARDTTINALKSWKGWPKPNFPIIFHSIKGGEAREGSSPSFFNGMEITQVMMYFKKLLRFPGIEAKDIGIISPYNAQVKKLRKEVHNQSVTVGSVEEFQGAERKVILVSTVRSNLNFLDFDARANLGFLANPKRFNVTVTRAQAGVIIVGDPAVLELDPLWCKFLLFIHREGGWMGQPWDVSRFDDENYEPTRARKDALEGLIVATEAMSLENAGSDGADSYEGMLVM
ncbi:hypothetical protein P7C70_g911, partial [Phenoliferia sp. Uapishka_3]